MERDSTPSMDIPARSASIYIPLNQADEAFSGDMSFSPGWECGFNLGRSPPRKLQRMRHSLPEDPEAKKELITSALSAAEAKRGAILRAQRERTLSAFQRAKEVASKVKQDTRRDEARLKENLQAHMEQAEMRRQRNLEAKRCRAIEHLTHVKTVHTRVKATRSLKSPERERALGQQGCLQTSRRSRQAFKIQSWWRRTQMKKAANRVAGFRRHGLSADTVSTMSFEDLVPKMRSKNVLMDCSLLLRRIEVIFKRKKNLMHYLERTGSLLGRLKCPVSKLGHFPPRIFLSSLMMVGDPDSIFTEGGTSRAERDLASAAEDMLRAFDAFCDVVKSNPDPQTSTRGDIFAAAWKNYLHFFLEWKEPDAQGLAQELVGSYVDMHQLKLRVLSNESRRNSGDKGTQEALEHDKRIWTQEIDQSLKTLHSHIMRLCPGNGDELIEEAMRRLDDGRRSTAQGQSREETQEERTTPLATDVGSFDNAETGHALSGIDETLAHELMFDPELTVDGPGARSTWRESTSNNRATAKQFSDRVQQIAKQAFWDVMTEELQKSPPLYERALCALADIKDVICNLTPNRPDRAAMLNEVLDIDLFRQQAANGAIDEADVKRIASFLVEKVLELQAPVRNEKTCAWLAAFRDMNGPISVLLPKALSFILDSLEEIKKDLVNAELRVLAAQVKEHGVEYERKRFAGALEAGKIGLEETSKWIQATLRDDTSLAHRVRRGSADAFIAAHRNAMVRLVTSSTSVAASCPETLRMDVGRIHYCQNEVQRIALLMVSLTIFRQVLAQHNVRASDAELEGLLAAMECLLKDEKCGVADIHAVTLKHARTVFESQEASPKMPEEAEVFLQSMMLKALAADDPIFVVLVKRIATVLKQCLVADEWSPRVCGQSGLEKVSGLLQELFHKLRNLAIINHKVHVDVYNKIMVAAVTARRPSE